MDVGGEGTRSNAPFLTRRRFLQVLGATAGSAAVANAMAAWGHLGVSAQTEPPKLSGRVNGVKVVILRRRAGRVPHRLQAHESRL